MDSLNFVNLIQAATVSVSVLGCLLFWRKRSFDSIAFLLGLIAFATVINLLEETGITRNIVIISPIFILLFAPAGYLAVKHFTHGKLDKRDWIHFLPVAPLLLMSSHVFVVIAIGTIWRLIYAYYTATLLIKYKRKLDNERSDADEFSFSWLVWLVVGLALFNLIDLVRLNSQPYISHELNVFVQGINNGVWLLAVMIITIKFLEQQSPPKPIQVKDNNKDEGEKTIHSSEQESYLSTFDELNKLVTTNQWFLTPRLTLNDVSEFTGLQTRDISRAINTVAKKSFNEYINEYRIKHICQALDAHTSYALTRLYTDAGFSSKASFNKVFKDYTGMTPSEYKAQQVI